MKTTISRRKIFSQNLAAEVNFVYSKIMSSNDHLVVLLLRIIKILSRYFLPSLLLIGNISCILSLIVFLQKTMRQNSSGLYFLFFTLCNLIFINISITTTIIFFGFNIDPTGKILFICQLEFYIGFVSSLLSTSFLVLASIDRFIMTSSDMNTHRFNTRSMAVKLILTLTLFSCIIHIHSFFLIIRPKDFSKSYSCMFQTGKYTLILSWYTFLVFGLLTPILMIIFGTRTIINVRRVMVNSLHRLHSIDRQLILIMLSQCSIHVIFRLPLPIYFIYDYIIRDSIKDVRYWTINMFFFYISLVSFYIPFCIVFFVNLMSHSFRVQFKRLMKHFCGKKNTQTRKLKKRRHQRVYPMQVIQNRNLPAQ